MSIKTIIRLNKPKYNKKDFSKSGFVHHDLFFPDGTCPTDKIIKRFFCIMEEANGAVAIHCKAGLGRTGTLIGLYLMREFGMCAADCIAWLRIFRPGSVLGRQQRFLLEMQNMCFGVKRGKNGERDRVRVLSEIFMRSLKASKGLKKVKGFGGVKDQGNFLLNRKFIQKLE